MKEEDDILKNKFILPAQARMFFGVQSVSLSTSW